MKTLKIKTYTVYFQDKEEILYIPAKSVAFLEKCIKKLRGSNVNYRILETKDLYE